MQIRLITAIKLRVNNIISHGKTAMSRNVDEEQIFNLATNIALKRSNNGNHTC